MSSPKDPAELARDTLKRLGERGLAPTPEHYAAIWRELSGASPETPPNWSTLIRDLLRQLEMTHKGVTLTRKKEGLETVLGRFGGKPEVLAEKLTGLIRSWGSGTAATELAPSPATAETPQAASIAPQPRPATPTTDGGELLQQLRELLAQSLQSMQTAHPELAPDIERLCSQVRSTGDAARLPELTRQLRQFWLKVELRASDKVKIQEGLLRLLRLLVENVSELTADDEWLQGQVAALQTIIAQPMDKHAIADAERSLRDVIVKQSLLKQSLTEAKSTLKNLMASFIDRLGDLTASTGDYHQKIEGYSQKISQTDDLTQLGHILQDVMHDTRLIQASALRSHEELLQTKKQADEAEARIRQLEQELMQVSELVREDQLTGALNRRGLEETMERELKRADRNQTSLCVALLDIDNFKKLNDTLGHQAGDRALTHLSQVIKSALRPSDAVGRYGGEEFVIVLPDTDLPAAVEAMQRLQRDLTKKFFLHNNERILVTFSAGVAVRGPQEDHQDLLGRADKAMYQAKHTGKNRVVAAQDTPAAPLAEQI
ncbi:MAG: diguanylate cyclase [Pseudomonadota bacterium]